MFRSWLDGFCVEFLGIYDSVFRYFVVVFVINLFCFWGERTYLVLVGEGEGMLWFW